MKAHISLIKKDLFLMGNYLCFIPVFTLVLPFFYYWRLPDFSLQKGTGLLILIVASVYSEFLAYEQIFLKDAEFPKALSLLCASPYRRRDIVLCRYLLFCLVFIATAVIYTIPAMLLPSSFLPTMPEYAVAFFLNTLLFCILTPLQYQFGFENSKFVLVIIIMASCFLLPVLLKKNALQPAWLLTLPSVPLFLALLFSREKRKKLGKWVLFSLLMTALYLPWMPYFYEQVTRVEAGYWIPPITGETVWSYFLWAFGLAPVPQTTYVFLVISLLAGISCLVSVKKGGEEGKAGVFALLCMAVPTLTAGGGILLSLLKQPIYRDQYVFPAMGLFCLFTAIGCRRFRKEIAALFLVFFLAVGAISYRDNYRAEYKATLTAQTEEFFSENLGERDLVVYNYQAYYFNYKYYFPEERLFYVRDVDLSRDFNRIWFLDTEMEWDFVPDQIIPYQLQIEYVGHYGIEDNEFDLYQVTKGAAPEAGEP